MSIPHHSYPIELNDCFISNISWHDGMGMDLCYFSSEGRPFSIAVGYENETLSSIQSSFHYPSVSLAFAKVNATYYPINRLRNIAINRTKTTHFFLADMDFWPSSIESDPSPSMVS